MGARGKLGNLKILFPAFSKRSADQDCDCPYFPIFLIFLFSETSLLIATIILGLLLIRPLPRQTKPESGA